MSKIYELRKLREKFNIEISGIENYPKNEVNVIVANHNCLMDIFFLPMIIPENIISFISSRLIYKNEVERKAMVDKYLYAMPIEAHGGKIYSDICLNSATDMLMNNCNISIFPEGAYVKDNIIYRGRTGASRILYGGNEKGITPNLVPVSIGIDKQKIDLDSYSYRNQNVIITIMPPIDYIEYYRCYMQCENQEIKNMMLHKPIDEAMNLIANSLNKEYCNEYIELYPKKNVIFEDGNVISTDIAQDSKYILKYNLELEKRKEKILTRYNR